MPLTQNDIGALLNFDALDVAEKIAKAEGLDQDEQNSLAMTLHLQASRARQVMLESASDSYYGISWKKFVTIVRELGFQPIYEESCSENGKMFLIFVFKHPTKHALLVMDTYDQAINSAIMYFTWKPTNHRQAFKYTQTGGWYDVDGTFALHSPVPDEELVWQGHSDVREAFRNTFLALDNNGTFLPLDKMEPFLPDQIVWRSDDETRKDRIPASLKKHLHAKRR